MPADDCDALLRAARWTAAMPFLDPDGSGPLDRLPIRSPRRALCAAGGRAPGRQPIPDVRSATYCLFAAPVAGSRQGKIVLAELRDELDPETGERYTVKRYASEKSATEDGWRHVSVTLSPRNPDFEPIVLTVEDEAEVRVIAELVAVLGDSVATSAE